MGHHRNPHLDQPPGQLDHPAATLQLDRVGSGLQEVAGVADGVLGGGVIAHERHVTHHQGVLHPAAHRPGVMQHLLHRHRQGVGVTQHGHPERVTDQQHRDAGLVQDAGGGEVVRGEHGEPPALPFVGLQVLDGHAHGSTSRSFLISAAWP